MKKVLLGLTFSLALVLGAVFDAAGVVDDGRRLDRLRLLALRHRDRTLEEVKDVLAVVVDVGVERAAGAEREQLHEHVVFDDEFGRLDGTGRRIEFGEFV